MTVLKIDLSCEVDNLISVVCDKTGKSFDEVETLFFKLYLYPETRKTYITSKFGNIVEDAFLNEALVDIFNEYQIDSIYITEAI